MRVIPAIDLKAGKCVRLLQGRDDAVTVYSDDPVSTAIRWQSCGARLLHVVDLDGAFTGDQKNLEAISKIRDAVEMEIEVGGGIRDLKKMEELITLGIDRMILGTVAVEQPELVSEACRRVPGTHPCGYRRQGRKGRGQGMGRSHFSGCKDPGKRSGKKRCCRNNLY